MVSNGVVKQIACRDCSNIIATVHSASHASFKPLVTAGNYTRPSNTAPRGFLIYVQDATHVMSHQEEMCPFKGKRVALLLLYY